jgi:hypothetical protein
MLRLFEIWKFYQNTGVSSVRIRLFKSSLEIRAGKGSASRLLELMLCLLLKKCQPY